MGENNGGGGMMMIVILIGGACCLSLLLSGGMFALYYMNKEFKKWVDGLFGKKPDDSENNNTEAEIVPLTLTEYEEEQLAAGTLDSNLKCTKKETYKRREFNKDLNKWVCPVGTFDTNVSWEEKDGYVNTGDTELDAYQCAASQGCATFMKDYATTF